MIKRVIILKDGLPLVNNNYEPGQNKDLGTVLGNYQTTIDLIRQKASVGQKKEEIISGNKVTYKKVQSVLFVVSSDTNEIGVLEIFLPELENLFFGVFPEDFVNTWQGDDISVFKGFEAKLDQLRSSFENRIMTKAGSRRVLDTLSVMELPQRLQKTALTILDAKIASFEEVITKTGVTPQEAVANIQEILNAGFLYTTKMGNKVYYSVKSFIEAPQGSTTTSIPAPVAPVTPSVTTTPTPQRVEPAKVASQPTQEEVPMVPGLVVEKRDVEKGNVPFLLKQIKKDVDKLFDALLNRKLVLIILDPESDKNQVLLNMLLDTLQCFAPERELRIVSYANDFIHPRDADIIRIERKLSQYYSNEVILDMDHKKISNGEDSIYLEEIINQMTKLPKHSECLSLLLNRVNLIEKIAKDWAKIKQLNLPSEDFVATIRSKHNPAILEIVERVAKNVFTQ